jgi:hypothetical protein
MEDRVTHDFMLNEETHIRVLTSGDIDRPHVIIEQTPYGVQAWLANDYELDKLINNDKYRN